MLVFPSHVLHREAQAFCYKFHSCIRTGGTRYRHKTLLNQPCANAPRAKTLRKENFLQLHVFVCHASIVARQFKPLDYCEDSSPAFMKTAHSPNNA